MGGLFIFILFAAIILPIIIVTRVAERKKWNLTLDQLSKSFNLTFTEGGIGSQPETTGSIQGFPVRIYRYNVSHGKSSTSTLGFSFLLGTRREVQISSEGIISRVGKLIGNPDIQLNDRDFDEAALVQGADIHEVRAVLHPEARAIITDLIHSSYGKRFTISNGKLETLQRADRFSSYTDIRREVLRIVRLAELLSRKGTTAELLRENYMAEKTTASRLVYLKSLHAVLGTMSEDNMVIRNALESSDRRLRFQAVQAMGKAGWRHIAGVFPGADSALAGEILDYAVSHRADALAPFFIKTCRRTTDWPLRTAIIRTLSSLRDPGVEPFLRQELAETAERPASYEAECIKALGRRGSPDDIEFLHGLRGTYPEREIDQAIARIQERIGTGDEGWLSVSGVDEDEGNLSIAEEEKP